MTKIQFEIPGKPQGKGRPRFTRYGGAYTPESTKMYEKLAKISYLEKCKDYKLQGPLQVKITAIFPIPKGTSKKKKELMLSDIEKPMKTPDVDNIAKIVLDALNNTAYDDDKQVIFLATEKIYGEIGKVVVEIEEVENGF